MAHLKVGFIGLGLIGGSIARAIKYFYPDSVIIAHSRSLETLKYALSEHIIDHAYDAVDSAYTDCDYIFLCAPVEVNAAYLKELKPLLSEHCILTDVGSTKTDIHEKVKALGIQKNFIGGHPMAGSEKTGLVNAKRILIENAYYVITPSDEVSADMVNQYKDFIGSLGALPLILNYHEHDYVTAVISHLPHIIAATLVNLVKDSDNPNGTMRTVAAGGFKDITRIASSSPEMWEQICTTNKENIVTALEHYIAHLEAAKTTLVQATGGAPIYALFNEAKEYRDALSDASRGSLPNVFSIYCDLLDETGGIAAVATILATNSINIKNIGIVHNREFEEAVLHIEFYEHAAMLKAATLLRKHHYTVYKR